MDRQIVYPAAIPQDTDLLNTNKFAMLGLGYALQAILGTTTLFDGLACTPTSPASMAVRVATGSVYSLQNIDATAYGSLNADTANQVVKQGIVMGNTQFTLTAPSTSGQSVVYLIQGQYQDVDGGSVVLPYYNASNPSVPYSGPGNAGTPNSTIRQGKCVLSLKVGTAAATGSQVTPTPDAGYTALWAITVANGATTVTSGNIARVATAPFIGPKLPDIVASIKTGSMLPFSTGATTVGADANNFFGLNAAVGSSALASFIIPFNYRISNFYGYAASTPTTGSRAYTVVINGSATSLTATATGTASTASDLTHSATGNAGDQIAIQIITAASDVLAHKASLMIQQIA